MEQYKRNQVDEALWLLFNPALGARLPKTFRNHIKRLLDIDRKGNYEEYDKTFKEGRKANQTGWPAFSDTPKQWGKGAVAQFSLFDTFCLALGLDFLDMGFKQSEVVFMVAQIRPELNSLFEEILSKVPAKFAEDDEVPEKDRMYLTFRRIEIREPYPLQTGLVPKEQILTSKYILSKGTEELTQNLLNETNNFRKALTVEMVKTVAQLQYFLGRTDPISRGRS